MFLACDGPRSGNREDSHRINEARSKIEAAIDWPCTITTRYNDTNQGTKYGLANAITWFFGIVEEGIVLEDDCLPSESFLPFCRELLGKYRHDTRIWQIAGTNHLGSSKAGHSSYHFSCYSLGWGWASWRRCWSHYDPDLKTWPEVRASNGLANAFDSEQELEYFVGIWDRMFYFGYPETWDYQWTYAGICQGSLAIVPCENQVSNIGFDDSGTYCTDRDHLFANLPTVELEAITHPWMIIRDRGFDRALFEKIREAEGKGPKSWASHEFHKLYYTSKYLIRKVLAMSPKKRRP